MRYQLTFEMDEGDFERREELIIEELAEQGAYDIQFEET